MTVPVELVDRLVADLAPAPRGYVARRLLLGLSAGMAIAAAIVAGLWGPRPDLGAAVATWPFWVKLAYPAALAAIGVAAALRLARPGLRARNTLGLVIAAFGALAAIALFQLALAPAEARRPLVMGATAAVCPWLITALALPIFACAGWAMRGLAPTRLSQAGAATGLVAGAAAALVYAFSCDEGGMPFVLVWYSLGIVVSTVIGALAGPRLLRW